MNTEYIESLIVRLCKQPRTFEFISKNVNGLDPVLLMEAIEQLEKKKILQKVDDLWSVKEKGKKQLLDFSSEDPQLYKSTWGILNF